MAQAPATTSSVPSPFSFGFQLQKTPTQIPPKPKKTTKKKNRRQQQQQQEAVATEEKSKEQVAPITTLESTSTILNAKHLNAQAAVSLHDLQCNGGHFVIQAFLEHTNLRRCVGLDTGSRYSTSEKNVRALVRHGYNGRRFMLVENMPGKKLTVIEKHDNSQRFKTRDVVLCFKKLSRDGTKKENYQGIVTKVYDKGAFYDVQMTAGMTAQRVSRELVFEPGTERILEIAAKRYLFEREDAFKAHIVVLPPNDDNAQLHRFLFEYISKQLPFGGRLLCASALHRWDGFPMYDLRQVDANVYENDTFLTDEDTIVRLYMYEHVNSRFTPTHPTMLSRLLAPGSRVRVRDDNNTWHSAQVRSVAVDESKTGGECVVHKTEWRYDTEETVALNSARIHLIRQKFDVGQLVSAFWPRLLTDAKDGMDPYELFFAEVLKRNADGSYQLVYEDADVHRRVEESWMFRPCEYAYDEHERVYINSSLLIEQDDGVEPQLPPNTPVDAIVRRRNPDGTYRVSYAGGTCFHDHVMESWMNALPSGEDNMVNGLLPLSFEFDVTRAAFWRPKLVARWASVCGFEAEGEILAGNGVNGVCLFTLTLDALLDEPLNFSRDRAKPFMMLIRYLRKEAGFTNEEDAAQAAQLRQSITNHQFELTTQQSKRNETVERLHQLLAENRQYMAYEEKLKCIHLQEQGMNKKDIALKLSKTPKWVGKYWKMNRNELTKPSGGQEIEFLKQEVQGLDQNIRHHKNLLAQQQEQMKEYDI